MTQAFFNGISNNYAQKYRHLYFFRIFEGIIVNKQASCNTYMKNWRELQEVNILIASILLFAICSCSSGTDTPEPPEPPEPPVVEEKIPINLSAGIETRATDTTFEESDQIGIYVVNYENGSPITLKNSENHVNNMKFTYTSSKWNPLTPIYWKDKNTKADFYGFYPYAPVSDISAHIFEQKTDQSTLNNYKSCEFLWGKSGGASPSVPTVDLTMKHIFSNIIIKVEPGDGFTAESLAAAEVSVSLEQIKSKASVNLKTGVATATGNEEKVTPLFMDRIYKAWVIPQTISADNFITITVDGKEFNLSEEFTFVANKQHTFTVKVSKTNNGMNTSIGAWETDDIDYGGTVI